MKPQLTPSLPRHHFTHLGASKTLYKRRAAPFAPWNCDFTHAGKLHKICLFTHELAGKLGAIAKAKLAIDAARNGTFHTYLAALKGKPALAAPVSTISIGDLLKCYEWTRIPDGAADLTRHRNADSLRNFLRRALGLAQAAGNIPGAPVDHLKLEILTEPTVMAFCSSTAARCARLDQLKSASARRTANSILAHVASVVDPRVLKYLASPAAQPRPLADIPDLTPFRLALEEHTFKKVPRASHAAPDDAIVAATLAAWPALPRNDYLAVGHVLACGLRKGEMDQARWSWHIDHHAAPFLRGQITATAALEVKNGTGLVEVQPLDPFWSAMTARITAEHWRGEAEDHILTGTASQRTEVFNRVSDWLRSLGWAGTKTNHALRAWAGQQVALSLGGIHTASRWLRHSSVTVTEQHYVHLEAAGLNKRPLVEVTWARHPSREFVPQIIAA